MRAQFAGSRIHVLDVRGQCDQRHRTRGRCRDRDNDAGAAGLEPTHARVKVWCLTNLATPHRSSSTWAGRERFASAVRVPRRHRAAALLPVQTKAALDDRRHDRNGKQFTSCGPCGVAHADDQEPNPNHDVGHQASSVHADRETRRNRRNRQYRDERQRKYDKKRQRVQGAQDERLARVEARPSGRIRIFAHDVGERQRPDEVAVRRSPVFLVATNRGRALLLGSAAPSTRCANWRSRRRGSTSCG